MKRNAPLLALGLVLLLSACAAGGTQPAPSAEESPEETAYHKITAEEAKEMMEDGDVTIVDVRRSDEYEAGHIPGAILIPNEDISAQRPEALPQLDATLLVYCRTGVRSKQASDKLIELGYENVYDMGGIVDWTYDTVTGSDAG